MKEIWKDILEFEGLYQVSNLGRVKSLPRKFIDSIGRTYNQPANIMKLSTDSNGYLKVNLTGHIKRPFAVGRIVLEAFIGKKSNFFVCRYKDKNITNNKLNNIYWNERQRKNSKNYCCIDCGNYISYKSALHGTGCCQKCINIRKNEKYNILTKSFLIKEYKHNKKSTNKIAKELGFDSKIIYKFLKKYKIKIRTQSEAKLGIPLTEKHKLNLSKNHADFKGKNSPNWIDGRSKIAYPDIFSYKLKQIIRKRDNFECQNLQCNLTQFKAKRKLDVHHIDYNKFNCGQSNLITLCHSCNTIANGYRDYWFAYYTWIMENRILKNV